ncbi:MAG: nuclear transport factor 2 family protein [Pseudomonadales bacterium]|nr:nuclear transport factor 2 family protein [Pseudomonadales bacterium]
MIALDPADGPSAVACDSCAIKNLIYQYAHYIDNGELDKLSAMFAEAKIVAVDGQGSATDIAGAQAVLSLYRSFTRLYPDDGSPHTLHMTSNVVVVIEAGASRASATSYAVVFQSLPDFPLQPIIGVRYFDRFARAGDGWHFSERRIDTRLAGDLSRHLLQPM